MDAQLYGIEDGLSHRDVQCIHQDRQGFLWFGTKYGLNRFDGFHFKWFTEEKDGLQSNEINHILEDGQGRMWLIETGAFNAREVLSMDVFDPFTNQVNAFEKQFPQSAPFAANEVLCFGQNPAGHLVFLTKKQLHIYTSHFESFPIDLGEFERIWSVQCAPDGRFWINAEKMPGSEVIIILDGKGKTLHQFQHKPCSHLLVYDLDAAGNGKYIDYTDISFSGRPSSLNYYRIDATGQRKTDNNAATDFRHFGVTQVGPMTQFRKNNGYVWIYTDDVSFRLISESSGEIQLLNEQYPNLKIATDLFFDNNQTAWVSTQFGIYHFDIEKPLFRKYLFDRKAKGSPQDFSCRRMTVDKHNQLWVAVENEAEIWRVDIGKNQEFRQVSVIMIAEAVLKKRDGQIVVYQDEKLIFLDPSTYQTLDKADLSQYFDRDIYMWTLHEDKYGKIWFDRLETRELAYLQNDRVTVLKDWFGKEGELYVYQFYETESDTAWVVTNGGLFTMNIKTGQILQRYWKGGTGNFHLPFDNVNHLHKDGGHAGGGASPKTPNSSFWLATAGTGLVHWSPTAGVIERFTRADGLPNNTLYAIYEDSRGNFWMPSDNGIAVFNKNTHQVRGYRVKDGIAQLEFNRISHYRDEAGNIYFGGLNGVTAFHPDDFLGDTARVQPPLVITEFQQFDGETDELVNRTGALRQSNTITMRPNDRFFLLEFALLTYNETDNIQYAWRVEGEDQDWNYQKENAIRLSRLPYGRHLLRIKGQASDGQWSAKELAINVEVVRPFYLQIWFLSIAGFLFLASGPVFHYWRTARLKRQSARLEQEVARRTETIERQAEELKSLENLKSRFFANVSHELRTPLSLMLGPVNSLLKRHKKEGDEKKLLQFVQRNAQQLQKLINEILDLSKLEDGKLEVMEEPVLFFPYLKEQLAQFYSAASSDKLNFKFEYKAEESLHILLDKSKFEKILHNYLSNAMKFTPPEGTVKLTVEESGSDLQISVSDTGRGIHPDDLPHVFDRFYQSKQPDTPTEGGTGIGLSLVKELADLLGGSTWVKSELGAGSVFYFRFPKKTASEMENGELKMENEPSPTVQPKLTEEALMLHSPHSIPHSSTILIVEDNQDLREYLQFLLSDYKVLTAENGQAALQIMRGELPEASQFPNSQFPDLIISDLMMPVMDGFQFLEKVKSDDRWRHLPFIMLTAKVNARARLNALRIGVDDYLTKPFEEEELKARISNLLHNYRERMEMFSHRDSARSQPETNKPPRPAKPVISAVDAEWLEEVEAVFTKHLSDSRLNVDFAADKLNLSERQFHRRLKQLSGLAPNQYLQEIRLQRAKDLLLEGRFSTVKEVAFSVGFQDVRYFSDLFEKHFGAKPSEMRK